MEFFRHCPGCGRRFHIKLESKTKISSDREPVPRMERGVGQPAAYWESKTITPVLVHDERPIILDIEDFQYVYKCKHCGHEWSEKHIEEHEER
jgi:hypothetical protein